MFVHLTLDIFCFSKLTVFLHHCSRKTDEARRQIFPANISHQMEAVVYMIIGYHDFECYLVWINLLDQQNRAIMSGYCNIQLKKITNAYLYQITREIMWL